MMNKFLLAAIATLAVAGAAQAHGSGSVNVTAPWVRATVPSQSATGTYMHLVAPRGARLVGVSSAIAARSELHQMEMQGDVMKMRQVDGIDLPAGKPVNLASGSYHIMLVGLKRRLKEGETVDLTLEIVNDSKQREKVTVKVPVKPMTFVSPPTKAAPAH